MDPGTRIDRIVAERGWLLADGATGTNLFAAGLPPGDSPELWNESHPQQIASLIEDAVLAGSELVLTNSFGCNSARLKLHGAEARSKELAQISAEIARDAADSRGRDVIVAGSVGPTGELMAPMGELTRQIATEIFLEQIEGLKRGGADLIWIETMSDLEELAAAAAAAALADIPWIGTMSFDSSGRTMMGVAPARLSVWAASARPAPIGFGANCGAGAADLVRTILEIADARPAGHIIAKGNAGIPKYISGHIHYDGSPELMADYAEMVRNAGAVIIGGCCGTSAEHLARMRDRLESTSKGPPPDLTEVAARLGPLTAPANGGKKRRPSRRRANR